jgi:hypothetical protein
MSVLLHLPLILVHGLAGLFRALFAPSWAYSHRCALRLLRVVLRASTGYLTAVPNRLRSHDAGVSAFATIGPDHMTLTGSSGGRDFKFSEVLAGEVDSPWHGTIVTHIKAVGGIRPGPAGARGPGTGRPRLTM